MPDTPPLRATEPEFDDLHALKAAIAQARLGPLSVPHAQVRGRLLEMVAEAEARIMALRPEGADQRDG